MRELGVRIDTPISALLTLNPRRVLLLFVSYSPVQSELHSRRLSQHTHTHAHTRTWPLTACRARRSRSRARARRRRLGQLGGTRRTARRRRRGGSSRGAPSARVRRSSPLPAAAAAAADPSAARGASEGGGAGGARDVRLREDARGATREAVGECPRRLGELGVDVALVVVGVVRALEAVGERAEARRGVRSKRG